LALATYLGGGKAWICVRIALLMVVHAELPLSPFWAGRHVAVRFFLVFSLLCVLRCVFLRYFVAFSLLGVLGALFCVFSPNFPILALLGAFFCVFSLHFRDLAFLVRFFRFSRYFAFFAFFLAWPGPRCVRPSPSLFVASGPFPTVHIVSRVGWCLLAFFALFSSLTLSIVPRTSVSPPRGPDFPDLGQSNLQQSFAAHFDSSRAFLSPFDAVE